MNSEVATKKHWERASRFHGMTYDGVEYVTLAIAVTMSGMSKDAFLDKTRKMGMHPVYFNEKRHYKRQELLDAIEKGKFEKYSRR